MRKYLIFLLIAIFLSLGASQVYYEGSIDSGNTKINMSLGLNCNEGNCPVSRWTVTMRIPENAEIEKVHSSRGEITSTERKGDELIAKSSTPPSESEKITITYSLTESRKEVHSGLLTHRINLPGFAEETNSGTFLVEDLLSASPSPDFEISAKNETLNYTGTGPGNIVVASGEGYQTDYYEFFGAEPKNTSIAYEITVGTLGFSQNFDRLPVAVMPGEKYDKRVNNWSAGQYTNATLAVREDLDKEFLPILAHESVHSFNDQRFDWGGDSSWFDEGTARYLEYLTKKGLQGESRTRSLFGKEKNYVEFEEGSRYRYSLPSKGDKEDLWNYYQNDRDFMINWNTEKGDRSFGYAYSELIIRNYIRNNNSLRDLYNNLEYRFSTDREKWNEVSETMDLTPCKYDERQKFENCLDSVNNYEYPVYRAENLSKQDTSLEVKKLELPERNQQQKGSLLSNDSGSKQNITSAGAVKSILGGISAFIADLIAILTG